MKKIILFIILMLLTSVIVSAEYEVEGVASDYNDVISVDNGYVGLSWLDKLLIGFKTPYNFIGETSSGAIGGNYNCQLAKVSQIFEWDTSRNVISGTQCSNGMYITYRFEGPSKSDLIFHELWYKSGDDDLPNFLNYKYTMDKADFDYSYACYVCDIDSVDDFEKGCLTSDKKECVSSSDSSCQTNYQYESECLKHISYIIPCLVGAGPLQPGQSYCADDDPIVEPQEITVPTVALRGEWQGIELPKKKVKPGETLTVEARFEAFEEGTYLLEAGIIPYEFYVVADSGSKCDGNVHFAGEYIFLEKNESIFIQFKPKALDTIGKASVILGAYTGCLAEGGEKINSLTYNFEITNDTEDESLGFMAILSSITMMGFGIFILVIFFIIGFIYWWKNK